VDGSESLPDEYPMSPTDLCAKSSGILVVGVETTVDVHRDDLGGP
jgi:hypothetical protein